MSSADIQIASRRNFLRFLAASPLIATPEYTALAADLLERTPRLPDPIMWGSQGLNHLIKDPKEAVNVFDFELVARRNVPPAHFGYMASGIDDEVTLRANRADFLKYQLRPWNPVIANRELFPA